MKVNSKILDEALKEAAMKRFLAELKEAMIFGPPILGEVLKTYIDKVEKNEIRSKS